MIDDLNKAFSELVSLSPNAYQREYEDLLFILINEFHWTQEDIWNTDIPFIFNVLNARSRHYKEQERLMKKQKR